MELSLQRIIGTYVLCLVIIPVVLVVIYAVVFGLQARKSNTMENNAKIQQFAQERGIEFKENMSAEEMEQLKPILSEVTGMDDDKIAIVAYFVMALTAVLQGVAAGYLLKSMKHVTVIAGISFFMSLVSSLGGKVTFATLVNLFILPIVIFLCGYFTVKRLKSAGDQTC